MNRREMLSLAASVLGLVVAPASGQVLRNFPADALRGALVVTQPPDAALNGNPVRLAPGARIRGQTNLLVLSGSLAGQRLLVNYTFDLQGQIKDVWILTPEEAAKRPWPTTPQQAAQWRFDPIAQTWTQP